MLATHDIDKFSHYIYITFQDIFNDVSKETKNENL